MVSGKGIRVTLGMLTVALSLCVAALSSVTPAAAASSMHVSRSAVAAGDRLTVTGSGFTASDVVVVYADLNVQGAAKRVQVGTTAKGDGTFQATISVPGGTRAGTYTVTAKDSHGNAASQSLRVLPLAYLQVAGPVRTVTVVADHYFFADGAGFQSGETVRLAITFSLFGGNTFTENRTVTANSKGKFYEVSLRIPADTRTNTSTLTAKGVRSGKTATKHINAVYRPYVVLGSSTVRPGNAISVHGHGFVANSNVHVSVTIPRQGGVTETLAATSTANGHGSFSASIGLPGNARLGKYTVSAQDIVGAVKASTSVAVAVHPSIALSTVTAAPGSTVTINGTGFSANATITVSASFALTNRATKTVSTAAQTDSNGTFSAQLDIPKQAGPGSVSVAATESNGKATAQLAVLPIKKNAKHQLGFRLVSLWYHVVRQGTSDRLVVQSTLRTRLGIWVHVIFPNGAHHDYYEQTNRHGHWATWFSVMRHTASRRSNQAYVTIQLWHGKKSGERFVTFTLV
jgi:hypothetical protein